VVAAVRAIGTVISESYFLGTAAHETNLATNERDTEPPNARGEVVQTWGLYQIMREEAADVGRPSANLLDLGDATWCMIRLAERRRALIRGVLRLEPLAPDPHGLEAYLAICHNMGWGTTYKTLQLHGLDWPSFRRRNPTMKFVAGGYGDDVLPKGP
jgi:hypothetical protein